MINTAMTVKTRTAATAHSFNPQAASVVIDYRTGYIVAMANGQNQPVTGIKPLTAPISPLCPSAPP